MYCIFAANMQDTTPSVITAVLTAKCPNCRKGNIFVNKSVFPLGKCLRTVERCSVCGQKIKNDGAPGMNYALSVVVYAIGFIAYALIWGITYKDNSFILSFIFSTVLVVLVQPWLMRLSSVIYLYLFTKYSS